MWSDLTWPNLGKKKKHISRHICVHIMTQKCIQPDVWEADMCTGTHTLGHWGASRLRLFQMSHTFTSLFLEMSKCKHLSAPAGVEAWEYFTQSANIFNSRCRISFYKTKLHAVSVCSTHYLLCLILIFQCTPIYWQWALTYRDWWPCVLKPPDNHVTFLSISIPRGTCPERFPRCGWALPHI